MLEAGEVSAVIDLGNQILGPRALTLAAAASSICCPVVQLAVRQPVGLWAQVLQPPLERL